MEQQPQLAELPPLPAIAVRLGAAVAMIALPLTVVLVLARKTSSSISQEEEPQQDHNKTTTIDTTTPSSSSCLIAGALCFVASQVIHVPLLQVAVVPLVLEQWWGINPADTTIQGAPLVVMALTLGVMAGICEEIARWLFYRYWLLRKRFNKQNGTEDTEESDRARTQSLFWQLVWFGIGHGGCEALIVGLVGVGTLVTMVLFQTRPEMLQEATEKLTDEQAQILRQQVDDYWAMEATKVVLGPVERFLAMTLHVALSLQVGKCFGTKATTSFTARTPPRESSKPTPTIPPQVQYTPLLWAILLHTGVNAAAVVVVRTWGVYATELVLLLVSFPLAVRMIWKAMLTENNSVDLRELSTDDGNSTTKQKQQ